MPITESDRILFNRIWALGVKAVRENRISALFDITLNTPTLEQYQDAHGQRMTDMIKIVQLGISQLRGSEELGVFDQTQTPTPSSRRFAKPSSGPLKHAS